MSYTFQNNQFVIENYDKKKTFSSFLPGIAGVKGIPLWAFYANRGQGITSFGIRDKDEPILEFFPANTSYQYVDKYGFRSFVKCDSETFEPFAVNTRDQVQRNMSIGRGHFTIEEINSSRQLHYKVTYFGLSNEPVAGLVRKVEITNLGETRTIEVLDGLANILPSGASTSAYKEMSNLMISWMGVENLDNNIPFYKFRASSGDEAEVSLIEKGHFYMSFTEDGDLIKPIVDPALIFAYDTSLSLPIGMIQQSLSEFDLDNQIVVNKVPCGFTPLTKTIEKSETIQINTIIGHVLEKEIINQKAHDFASKAYIDTKANEAEGVVDELVDVVETETNYPLFDAYIKQNFLDNMLRGGYPFVFGQGENQKVYHIFSRKHGDPERDYNFFKLSPEFYSQGNGNFRDVNQNRRNDVYFVPEAGLFNVKMFMSLVQLDGYNPLGVQGTTFTIDIEKAQAIVNEAISQGKEIMLDLLKDKFSPGSMSMAILLNNMVLNVSEETFISDILMASDQHIEAVFGEGYWVDHWTYTFDLIENYLSVYPDQLETLLHHDKSYPYFESPVTVLPRSQKYGLTKSGTVRQYGSIKEESHGERFNQSNWTLAGGQTYKTNLAQKLLSLVLTKFSTLDPFGMGIEMEANKPGWNDAMNGLPGVFGSGLSESIELVRIVRFLKNNLKEDVLLLKENHDLFMRLKAIIDLEMTDFDRWDQMVSARERFRAALLEPLSGQEEKASLKDLMDFLSHVEVILLEGIHKARDLNEGIIPTYLTYEVSDFEPLDYKTPYGLQAVKVKGFDLHKIPNFLEAPARSFKIGTPNENRAMYERIKKTDIYDEQLRFYKTSGSLDDMSHELGRIRAFTPGWLERESNFLHMTYKYLLGLLKGGLYETFFEEIKTNLVCFMEPSVYGRSTLENSSFIASSVNPNPNVVGQGFVARLSGSTAEMLSIWNMMMIGKHLFTQEDELVFTPKPLLTPDFFKEGRVTTSLLSDITFIIENNTAKATFDEGVEVAYYTVDGQKVDQIKGDLAHKVRDRQVKEIVMVYQNK